MQPLVLEGPWEEMASHSKELAGHRVRVTVMDDDIAGETPALALKRTKDVLFKRTPEEIAEARAAIQPGCELPPGKTLWDVLNQMPGDEPDLEPGAALKKAMDEMLNRTPEEIAESHARARAAIQPGRPLPPGKTLMDVIFGQWPGDETDEEISAALKELS